MTKSTLLPEGATLLASGEEMLAWRRLPEAIALLLRAQALAADPDRCAAGLWMAYMLSGDFESGWRQSDAIRRRGAPDPHRFWQGESLAGKRVIVRCLHGFGDATQFLRYLPALRAVASTVIVEAPPRFADLARRFDGVDQVITWGASAPSRPPLWDVQLEIMELPYIFRTNLGDLPIATNYLHPQSAPPLQSDRAGSLRVGLAWSAGEWNPARAIDIKLMGPVFEVRGCEFWNLQGNPQNASGAVVAFMHQEEACRETIAGLAATISQLDLVITVDTLAAHLAGALGVRAWLMLQYEADWRWMHGRSDSPWYPSLGLFRQPSPGDWKSVVAAVSKALQALQEAASVLI